MPAAEAAAKAFRPFGRTYPVCFRSLQECAAGHPVLGLYNGKAELLRYTLEYATRTPGPIVDERTTLLTYVPFAAEGFAL